MKIAFDIGGVLSKYPDQLRPLIRRLLLCPASIKVLEPERIEVHVVSDMHDKAKMLAMLHANDLNFPADWVHSADYAAHGEECKAILCEQLGIDVLIDDFAGYVATVGKPLVRLLVMPDPTRDYYAPAWKTDGSEGNFGRRNPPGSKRPPEGRA